MKREYRHNLSGFSVVANKWTGDNLGEIIDMIGLHPSVEHLKWEAYEELVKKEGFVVFGGTGKAQVEVGSYITFDVIRGAAVWHPIQFLDTYTAIDQAAIEGDEMGHKVVTMEEIKRWIPLAKMENADAAEYKYRIEAAYHVQMKHEILTPIPYVGTKEVVLYEFPELVALCPVTFLVDVYKVDIKFIPGDTIPELKSLKYNFSDYIQLPISHEHLASRIYRDIKTQIDPDKLQIVLHTNVRGGITTTVTVGDAF